MDYAGWLRANGILALAAVKAEKTQKLEGTRGNRFGALRSRMRQSIVGQMQGMAVSRAPSGWRRWLVMNEEDTGVLAAMVIGEQSLIQRATKTDFQKTGTFHILVVSGMNVAILAFVIFWMAKKLRAGEIAATLTTITLSLLYAYVTDLGTPIVRAALMLSIYLAARLLYRAQYSLNGVGLAALIVLVWSPVTLFEASFQFTFLSVVVLSAIVQPLLERTIQPYSYGLRGLWMTGIDTSLEPRIAQFRIELRMIAERMARLLPKFLSEERRLRFCGWSLTSTLRFFFGMTSLFATAFIMQLALALPMVWYFHRVALLGVPANMAVVPLTQALMPSALIAALLMYVSPMIAKPFIMATAVLEHGILLAVNSLGGARFADFRVPQPALWICFVAAAAVIVAMITARARRSIAIAGFSALVIASLLLALPTSPHTKPGVVEVTAIDVGQGDSILIVTLRTGTHYWSMAAGRWGSPTQKSACATSMLVRTWSLRTCGRAASGGSMPSRSPTRTPTTSADCARWSQILLRMSCGWEGTRRHARCANLLPKQNHAAGTSSNISKAMTLISMESACMCWLRRKIGRSRNIRATTIR